MTALQVIIVLEWFATLVGAVAFLVLFGRPWRYQDKVMAWHLAMLTAAVAIEVVALIVTGWSLLPSAIAYGLGTGLVYWRLWLLLRTRRRR